MIIEILERKEISIKALQADQALQALLLDQPDELDEHLLKIQLIL